MTYYTLPQVAEQLGEKYRRVLHATLYKVVEPIQYGHTRLYTPEQVEILRKYFDAKQEGKQ